MQKLGDKLLVILGPTATGKTDLALQFADKFQGELVSVDSRQVYKNLDIGTGKMPSEELEVRKGEGWWEINKIKVWMYDVVDFKTQYSVADYIKDAKKVIEDIQKRGKLPILVGGTGFYIKSLIYGLPNLSMLIDQKLRQGLEQLSLNNLQEMFQKLAVKKWGHMNYSDRQNPRRLVRAIELSRNKNEDNLEGAGLVKEFDILKIGLTADRETLYQRSDERVISRIKQGMIEEAKRLNKKGLSLKRMKQLGLEYGILADYLQGEIKDEENFIKILQGKIHNYIKRQLTWFKKEKNIKWFDITKKNFVDEVEKQIGKWYHHSDAKKN